MSWLGRLNFWVLQWFFVRLEVRSSAPRGRAQLYRDQAGAMTQERLEHMVEEAEHGGEAYDLDVLALVIALEDEREGRRDWFLLRWAWPMSGWDDRPYRYLGRKT